MERSTFFKTLVTGVLAAPSVAKSILKEPDSYPKIYFANGSGIRFNPEQYLGEIEWRLCEDGMIYYLDNSPLRYTIKRIPK